MTDYDAIVLLSFGGPEGPDDVVPFLENVTRGRGIPRERLAEVGEHYFLFGGVSPINAQNRALIDALDAELRRAGHDLPIYWGNRNWSPYLTDTVEAMAADGVRRALALVTSAYSSYSACRQYLDDIDAARAAVGPGAPTIDKIRAYWNHPGFVEAMADRVTDALADPRLDGHQVEVVFTAHSIPAAMAATSDYVAQLVDASTLVAEATGIDRLVTLVYQSRSGPPQVPWLEPDINDHLRARAAAGATAVMVVPIGFVSDHMEVVYDLDTQARATADETGLVLVRAGTVGTHPRFVGGLRELVEERLDDATPVALGPLGARPMPCAPGCCPAPARPGA